MKFKKLITLASLVGLITFLLSLVIGKGRVLQIITSIIVILVSIFGILVHFSITQELVGRSNLGFGAILYYVCVVINLFAAIMIIKGDKATSEK